MATSVTATEAARRFSDLLNRVRYRGDSFVIVRGGEAVARLSPAVDRPRATVRSLFELLGSLDVPDPDFADDLERIQAEQPAMPEAPWGS